MVANEGSVDKKVPDTFASHLSFLKFFLLFLHPIARGVCDMPELGLQDYHVPDHSWRETGCHCTSMS